MKKEITLMPSVTLSKLHMTEKGKWYTTPPQGRRLDKATFRISKTVSHSGDPYDGEVRITALKIDGQDYIQFGSPSKMPSDNHTTQIVEYEFALSKQPKIGQRVHVHWYFETEKIKKQ